MHCSMWPSVGGRWGSKITTRVKFWPLLSYLLCQVYASTMRIERCSKGSNLIAKRFLGEKFRRPVKNGPEMALIRRNGRKWSSKYSILCSRPRKSTFLRGTASCGVFASKSVQRPCLLRVARTPKTKKTKKKTNWVNAFGAQSLMRGNETLRRIVANFCTGVGRGPSHRNHLCQFLPRDAMQARPMLSCGVCLSVCVCMSVTFVHSVKTNKHHQNCFIVR